MVTEEKQKLLRSIESRLMFINGITRDLEVMVKSLNSDTLSEDDMIDTYYKYKELVIDLKHQADMSDIELRRFCQGI